MNELKDLKKTVKFLRLNDAGEKFAMEKASKQHHLGLQFEFSGQRTLRKMASWKESSKPFTED
jgi:hypothetical protein